MSEEYFDIGHAESGIIPARVQRVGTGPIGVPRWVLIRVGGAALHTFPVELDFNQIAAGFRLLGMELSVDGSIVTRPPEHPLG